MVKKTIMIMAVALMFLPSCKTEPEPRGQLLIAQKTFTSTVNSLTILRDAGKFSNDDMLKITALVRQGDKFLDEWTESVLNNEEPEVIEIVNSIILQLIEYKERGESNE